ncbi:MAG TPA: flagellar basal body P-ring protein FlgI [Candidatus Cybelea sp.]|nr:flagellar basal body P-ring protein FlgI [Candidatus Cybelea sp.]
MPLSLAHLFIGRFVAGRLLRSVFGFVLTLALLAAQVCPAAAISRIKDIADFEGVRENMLVGYGLVVGLDGTGDSLRNAPFTRQSLDAMLERMGVNIRDATADTKNVAAVMVTANLPPFARQGNHIDVSISAMGDAKSLQGGTLLVTPLMGADGEVYAVAQGSVAIGGFTAQGAAQSVTKGIPTSGRMANGAIVEREVGFELSQMSSVRVSLRNPDLTTARRMAQAINAYLGTPAAQLLDPSTVLIGVPDKYKGNVVALLGDVEELKVEPDQQARVVIDENNGIIVMGKDVRISTVAIAQGNLTIRITETPQVSQPNAFAPGPGVVQGQPGIAGTSPQVGNFPVQRRNADGTPALDSSGKAIFDVVPQAVPGTGVPSQTATAGQISGGASTVVVPRTQIDVDEGKDRRLGLLAGGVSLEELVNGLNALGIGPRDMISILQTIKAAGSLQAEIVVR